MSKSLRRPYAAIAGGDSARIDKKMAGHGMRRKQTMWLHNHWQEDDFLLPARLECGHNNTYDWGRDGSQFYRGLTARDWNRYMGACLGIGLWAGDEDYMVWPPQWYRKMIRK